MGLNGALQIGRSAMLSSQAAISVTGNNLANAATPGYHRQIAGLTPNGSSPIGRNQFVGTGVALTTINRAIDSALQSRLRDAISDENAAAIDERFLSSVEAIQNELSDNDLSSKLSAFFNAFSELANNPIDNAVRSVVVQQAVSLTDHVNLLQDQYTMLRTESDRAIGASVERVDGLLGEIAVLNGQIAMAEGGGGGGGANSLRDRRDQLIDEVSGFIDIDTVPQENGSVDILVGSIPVVLAGESRGVTMRTQSGPNGLEVSIRVEEDGTILDAKSGSIGALQRQREETILPAMATLDDFASQLVFQVNDIHAQGQGLANRTEVSGSVVGIDADENLNATGSGVPWEIRNGVFELHVVNASTGLRATYQVAVDPDEMSLQDLVDRINVDLGVSDATASIGPSGEFRITAGPGHEIAFSDDSSGVLAGLGVNGLFTGSNAREITVDAALLDDPSLLATSKDFTSGGNDSALAIVELENRAIDAFGGRSLREKWQSEVNTLAVATGAARTRYESSVLVRESLEAQNQAVSGVSIDEEAIDLMTLQRQFQAAARFITVIDEAMQVLLSIA
ncbi:MAG: flagellar hook-associated protein FlgK [Phycisphaeraceae bacterium]|nr:flagellar hook-associated protein FlgK [Phycisphaeraceae bacterium]MCP4012177.1 flagellar hook-associated protein FlgK [Phycisphaeraceae bacterium]MCP4068744.1 flagellar hook-associated protein FlgK [Phycisphaeraceae bacterium]MCP4796541.1 flagellar hook-associated protein FlgK [Phycisphaeraceae bacterium]HAC08046.1 flagellar hook-associated protein FlgK [Phycisphaerales bacterium]